MWYNVCWLGVGGGEGRGSVQRVLSRVGNAVERVHGERRCEGADGGEREGRQRGAEALHEDAERVEEEARVERGEEVCERTEHELEDGRADAVDGHQVTRLAFVVGEVYL